MRHAKATHKETAHKSEDEHTLLEQEDFRWLGELRDVLSPYWSARQTYRSDGTRPVQSIDGLQEEGRN